jgi:hypothetical protein
MKFSKSLGERWVAKETVAVNRLSIARPSFPCHKSAATITSLNPF